MKSKTPKKDDGVKNVDDNSYRHAAKRARRG